MIVQLLFLRQRHPWEKLKKRTAFLIKFALSRTMTMKMKKSVLLAFSLLILASSLYRVWPDRPFGFAPQWAMALFAGAVIKDKKWAFLLPLVSMLVSDTLYQILYNNGVSQIWGFYGGQWLNYL